MKNGFLVRSTSASAARHLSFNKALNRGSGFTLIVLICASLIGCVSDAPTNPSFDVSIPVARRLLDDAAVHPRALKRPLVIVGGFADPGLAPLMMRHQFQNYTTDDKIVSVSLGFCFTFDQCRRRIIEAVDETFPSNDPRYTTEVDVIGFSLGGVAARYAAMDAGPNHRLRIARLFTISSPHRGALLAEHSNFSIIPLRNDLLLNSSFLEKLNNTANLDDLYPIYAYIRLGDNKIGNENAAPPGQTAWWVSTPPFSFPHASACLDPRILADIVLRLRDEPPLATDPPSPFPIHAAAR
jgi:hypothetical protein